MAIRFQCDCGKKLKATDEKIGKRVMCPDCGEPVTVPSKSRRKVETLGSDQAVESPEQDSSQTARQLLKLSTAASREEQPSEKPSKESVRHRGEEATVTFGEFVKYNGMKYALPAVGVVIACFVLYNLSDWLLGSNLKYPPLHPVSGTVKLNGKPLAGATVTFRSQEALMSDSDVRIGASSGVTDSEGRYKLQYVPGVPGAVLGVHSVEVNQAGPDGVETLPARFHMHTELKAEVKAGQKDGYNIELKM